MGVPIFCTSCCLCSSRSSSVWRSWRVTHVKQEEIKTLAFPKIVGTSKSSKSEAYVRIEIASGYPPPFGETNEKIHKSINRRCKCCIFAPWSSALDRSTGRFRFEEPGPPGGVRHPKLRRKLLTENLLRWVLRGMKPVPDSSISQQHLVEMINDFNLRQTEDNKMRRVKQCQLWSRPWYH